MSSFLAMVRYYYLLAILQMVVIEPAMFMRRVPVIPYERVRTCEKAIDCSSLTSVEQAQSP